MTQGQSGTQQIRQRRKAIIRRAGVITVCLGLLLVVGLLMKKRTPKSSSKAIAEPGIAFTEKKLSGDMEGMTIIQLGTKGHPVAVPGFVFTKSHAIDQPATIGF